MFEANRRIVLQSIAIGAGTFAASQSLAAGPDGHAAGYEVSAASEYLKTIPRKSGDPVVFTPRSTRGRSRQHPEGGHGKSPHVDCPSPPISPERICS
ncbi:hypothetical protein AB8Z38_19435 [Bradyrhizobium sp. LLZ17]|uniref:Uncharacterized protein n=1 Tax=Bradyrhizobium sp. LLZ17 TaxID=3239388 RepID=A0AB39XAH8_9BRAD